jgi:molybdopterin/thiamine biosynthesis adenylyltransferase
MAHLVQVGAGSGGMPVLDMVAHDPRITRITLIEPDIYQPHNVVRHLFPRQAVGEYKAVLAQKWLQERRCDLQVRSLVRDLLDPAIQDELHRVLMETDIAVCAADNEPAKFHWDHLMRRHRIPWTLGEVLSGGIGGFVHWFVPDGPCYGCVAGFLQRTVEVEKAKAPDYSQPGGPEAATTVPATKASIQAVASLHALVTLRLLQEGSAYQPGFTSLLLTLERVPDVFEEAFRTYRFRVPRADDCLICRPGLTRVPADSSPEELDVALDQALARLGNE